MQDKELVIESNNEIAHDVFYMCLSGDDVKCEPGQFIDIMIDGHFLRRPISVLDSTEASIEIIYKVAGKGTDALAGMEEGDVIRALLPLGNGFDIHPVSLGEVNLANAPESGDSKTTAPISIKPLLVAGGIGMPPIYALAKKLTSLRISYKVVLGFKTIHDMLPLDRFYELEQTPVVALEDIAGVQGDNQDASQCENAAGAVYHPAGDHGDDLSKEVINITQGLVTDAMRSVKAKGYDFDYVYACGPEPMLKAVYGKSPDGQFSFEERMGCGFGACMGCSHKTKNGYKRICKDGPVLAKDEIVW